ncbi:hypothetical protein KY345_04290 [Candidatus Woesearchaeota archaeon]|nr:hypothetical protein [Candidatus Woesearchaeota archaeon]
MKKNKIIKEMDDDIWRKFTGYCKIKGSSVSGELKKILEKYLREKLK